MTRGAQERADFAPPREVGALFLAHRARVYRWALAHGLSHEEALDVVQEAFARMLASHPLCPGEGAQVAWLKRTASNIAVDMKRKGGRLRLVRPSGGGKDGEGVEDTERARLRAAIAKLSELQRLVLLEKAVEGQTFAEIAAQLGMAVPTAKTHYARALNALRSAMGTTTGGES